MSDRYRGAKTMENLPELQKVIDAGQQIADRMLVGDGTPGPPRFPCRVHINSLVIEQDLYEDEIETLARVGRMFDKKHRGRVLLSVERVES